MKSSRQKSGCLAYCAVAALVIVVLAYPAVRFYAPRYDANAEGTIRKIIPMIESFGKMHNRYPAQLSDVPGWQRQRQRILLILPPPEIFYKLTNYGYRILYYSCPFGPFVGYDGKSKTWYAEE